MKLRAEVIDVITSKHPDAEDYRGPWTSPGDKHILVTVDPNGNEVSIISVDGGEPEDQRFGRDLSWTIDLLQRALDAEHARDVLAARLTAAGLSVAIED